MQKTGERAYALLSCEMLFRKHSSAPQSQLQFFTAGTIYSWDDTACRFSAESQRVMSMPFGQACTQLKIV